MNAAVVVCVLVATAWPAAAEGTARKWTASSGNYSVEATFVDYEDGQVLLEKTDGTRISVALEKLSRRDQSYVRSLLRKRALPERRRERPAPKGDDEMPEQAAVEGELFSTVDRAELMLKYRANRIDELERGEWPGLFVFLTRADGPDVDQNVVQAEGGRAGMPNEVVGASQARWQFAQIAAEGGQDLAGYRVSLLDTERKRIRPGILLEVPFEQLKSLRAAQQPEPGRPAFDVDWLGPRIKATAAVAAFKTDGDQLAFQRFLTPVATRVFEPPAGDPAQAAKPAGGEAEGPGPRRPPGLADRGPPKPAAPVDELVPLLRSSNPGQRAYAVHHLGLHGAAAAAAVDALLPLLGDQSLIRIDRNSWDKSVTFRPSTPQEARTHNQARNLMGDQPPPLALIVAYSTDFRPMNEIVVETFKAIGEAAVEPLIAALDNPAKRVPAAIALEAITGQRFSAGARGGRGRVGPPTARAVDVAAWQKWWEENRNQTAKEE